MNKQMIYLAILAGTINTCFTFQNTNLSSILKFLGATNNHLPLLWIIPPLTGLIMQPIIGQISDDTVTRFGKRRPYIFMWGLITTLAFLLLPLFNSLFYTSVLFLIIDCSLNGSLEAIRALTGDNIKTQIERAKAFALQSSLSGAGGVIGASLPLIIYKIISVKDETILTLPYNIKISFIILGLVSLITLYLCLVHVKEKIHRNNLLRIKRKNIALNKRIKKIFFDFSDSINKMPKSFKSICYIHGMNWTGIFIFWLYVTVTLAQNIYGLPSDDQSITNQNFTSILQHATLDSSFYFSIYQYVSIIYSVFIYFKSKHSRLYLLHASSLLAGGFGLLMVSLAHTTPILIVAFILIGLMWGSMMILPYCIVIQLLPRARIGIYFGIFNICITLPQIICGLLLPPLYSFVFHEKANYLLILSSFLVILSAILWARQEKRAENAKQLYEFSYK